VTIGSILPAEDVARLLALKDRAYDQETVSAVQSILDPYCLAGVSINPEARVMVVPGPAEKQLISEGWTNFLVKIHNQGGVTGRLKATGPTAQPVLHISTTSPRVMKKNELTEGELDNRFLEVLMFEDRPMKPALSGLPLEYAIIQVYTCEKGKREARLGFDVGEGTQDLRYRNTIDLLFDIKPSVKVIFNIKDFNGEPARASRLIRDGIVRIKSSEAGEANAPDYRLTHALRADWIGHTFSKADVFAYDSILPRNRRLTGIYPLPARRSALMDEYPD